MNEAALQTRVMDYAQWKGWRVAHVLPALRADGRWVTPYSGDPGLSDLILARRGRVLLAELKSEDGRFRKGQREWLEAAGDNGKLWRPADWNTIVEELR